MISIEENLKKAVEFYNKSEESISDGERDDTIYNINRFTQAQCYMGVALYHQNQAIIQLLSNIVKSPGIRGND